MNYFTGVVNGSVVTCPSQIAVRNESIYSYPIDIYQGNRAAFAAETTHTCFAADLKYPSYHTCSYSPFCPIQESNIQDALALMTWTPYSEAFCRLNAKKSKKPRVFIFGGSVTVGSYAFGCCCVEQISKICPFNKRCTDAKVIPVNDENLLHGVNCTWHNYLRDLLVNSEDLRHVEVIPLPKGGRNSIMMSTQLIPGLVKLNYHFTAEDLILLDYSVNDGFYVDVDSEKKKKDLRIGLENLIRNILAHSISSSSFPTIVLLDFFPQTTYYSETYLQIARHYNLMLWSYRNMVISEATNRTQTAYIKYLNFLNNHHIPRNRRDAHPPWYMS